MQFKCRVCGWNSFSTLFGPFDGEAYQCDNCSTIFKDLKKFSLNENKQNRKESNDDNKKSPRN